MKRTITGQVLASTRLDRQGEHLSADDLHAIFASTPAKMPLRQHHDLALPVCGEMTNFRLGLDPDDLSHHVIVCDVTYDDELITDFANFGGFSWSALCDTGNIPENSDCHIYLPFRFYNDQSLVDSLLASDPSIGVGKWLKKGANSAVLLAMVVFLAKPLWDTVYKEVLEESVKRLIARLKALWPANVSPNCLTYVPIPTTLYEPQPQVVFLPSRTEGIE
jgi:hypothetical protein